MAVSKTELRGDLQALIARQSNFIRNAAGQILWWPGKKNKHAITCRSRLPIKFDFLPLGKFLFVIMQKCLIISSHSALTSGQRTTVILNLKNENNKTRWKWDAESVKLRRTVPLCAVSLMEGIYLFIFSHYSCCEIQTFLPCCGGALKDTARILMCLQATELWISLRWEIIYWSSPEHGGLPESSWVDTTASQITSRSALFIQLAVIIAKSAKIVHYLFEGRCRRCTCQWFPVRSRGGGRGP